MNKTQEQLEKLREVAEASLTKTEELQKVLAQIEALMSREESQKVSKKINKQNPFQSFLLGLEVLPSLSKRPLLFICFYYIFKACLFS